MTVLENATFTRMELKECLRNGFDFFSVELFSSKQGSDEKGGWIGKLETRGEEDGERGEKRRGKDFLMINKKYRLCDIPRG